MNYLQFEYTDMLMAYHLEKRWNMLYQSSFFRFAALEPVKMKFADMTTVEINSFAIDVIEYSTIFDKYIDFYLTSVKRFCEAI